ncbi:MAG: hypothetical protein KatS3mg103_1096 [Phycisphaerales bacterium]|nr:MAG: hypothetical protein KatS3mg103_1096 [Phycisphaerales bacterium]
MLTAYLDNNATTRPLPEVVQAVCDCLEHCWANPSSLHREGQAARKPDRAGPPGGGRADRCRAS